MAKPKITYEITAEDKSRRAVNDVEKRLKSAAKIGAAALGASAVAAAAGIFAMSKRAAEAADNISRLSTQLGIGTKALSQYQFVAEQTGVRFDTFAMALQRMTRRVAEAAQGTGEAQGALRELGIDAARLGQLDPGAQFEVLAEQLNKVTSESDQVRLAFKLFDSEGVRLLRTIKSTGGEFDALKSRASELGAVIDDDLAKKGVEVQSAMAEIGTAISGLGNSLLNTFGPAIVAAANNMVSFINKARRAAEAVGLLDARLTDLKLDELNEKWLENNRQIVRQERALKVLAKGDRARTVERIAALDAENEKIKEQIAALKTQGVERARVETEKAAAVTGAVGATSPTQEASDAEFQRYLESLLSEEEALRASYERRLKIIEENTTAGSDQQLSLKEQEYARLETALLKHQANLGNLEAKGILARRKFEEQNTRQRTKTVLNEIATLTAGVAQNSKTMFKINKVAAIANAVIGAYEGISRTLAAYPYPINIGMAALHAAAAFAQVQAIRSTSFSGGGAGTTPSLAGTTGVVNDIPIETAPVAEEGLTAAPANNVINISFDRGITDTESVRQFIETELSEALRDGAGLDVRVVAQ